MNQPTGTSRTSTASRSLNSAFRKARLFQLRGALGRQRTFIDWNGDGIANEELFLEGEQCLVFHLGGIPQYGASGAVTMTGFSNNVQQPGRRPAGRGRAAIFEFQSARLESVLHPFRATRRGRSSPYTWTRGNPRRRSLTPFSPPTEGGGDGNYLRIRQCSDCPSLGVLPYILNSRAADRASVCQRPARSRSFRPAATASSGAGGTNWNPASGTSDPNGKDDQANFSPRLLGAPAN